MSRGLLEILGSLFAGRRKSDGEPAPQLSLSVESPGIYARAPSASILASVLSANAEGAEPVPRDAASTSAAQTLGVGEELRKAREGVFAAGEALAALSDDTVAAHIRRLIGLVEGQHCSIAFIGQMNAGKSSLINAFIGAPNFLPAEITPWTTVVTNLYFGIPKMPVTGAVFEFFSTAEWQQLAEGSSRVRALTDRLVPDFRWDDFYRQVGSMRDKAEEKLGARYAELLGTQHSFPLVTTEILEKYIAAESPLGDEGAGEYSMITKAAHLYFDLTGFLYPTMVIDTPGVNDPFLVRDEITRQNLERANIFVIVVTARQPLSNADLDLLRVLRGLKKEHIVIFVNKVDEIDDFATHSGAIADRIRGVLAREFPGVDIPIVMGSAYWAETALADDADAKLSLAHDMELDSSGEGEMAEGFWPSDPALQADIMAERILTRSGIGDLALSVSSILQNGGAAGSIRYAATVLAAIARNGAARADQALGPEDDAALREAASAARTEIKASIAEIARRFDDVVARHRGALAASLQGSIEAAVMAHGEAEAGRADAAALHLPSLVVRLRNDLEQTLLRHYQQALAEVTELSRGTEAALTKGIGTAAGQLGMTIDYAALPVLTGAPSLAALGEPVATDLGGLLQGRLEGARSDSGEHAARMQASIVAEFQAIAGRLVQAAGDELTRSTGFILDHFRVTAAHMLRSAIAARHGGDAAAEARQGGLPSTEAAQNGAPASAQAYRGIAEQLASLTK